MEEPEGRREGGQEEPEGGELQEGVQEEQEEPGQGPQVQSVAALAAVDVVGLEVGEGDHEVDGEEEEEAGEQQAGHQEELWGD